MLSQNATQGTAVFNRRQQNQLTGYELVTPLLGQLVGNVEQSTHVVRHGHIAGIALNFRQVLNFLRHGLSYPAGLNPHLFEQRFNGASLLVQQGLHQMHGLDEVMVFANRDGLRIRQRGLQLAGELVDSHVLLSPKFVVNTDQPCGPDIPIALKLNVGASGGSSSWAERNSSEI